MRRTALGVVAVALLVAAGCQDDDGDAVTGATTPGTVAGVVTAAEASVPAPGGTQASSTTSGQIVTVLAADYAFGGIPGTVQPGTQFRLQNDSAAEVHEMVAIRIPDGEERSIEELVALPEEESDAIFAGVEPAFVIVAGPGEEGRAVVGDGTVTEEGRYAVVCFIPKGADPAEFMAAMSEPPSTDPNATEGPPDVAGGPPHVTEGMFAEFTVQTP